ncbi:MAG: AmmeMemoRadiSam system protein B [Anaerolineae bacterium]|jgi:AmmeMemoRadiSam system protein B|nr:AmmeMemoRadiSam system protein B [Chloroflexota bacterium]
MAMWIRKPRVAGLFYPSRASEIRSLVEAWQRESSPTVGLSLVGGVVPHAGWVYSGSTAMRLYAALAAGRPVETVLLYGAVHTPGVYAAAVYPQGAWRTPLGDVPVDEDLAQALIACDERFAGDADAHADEHALEVQLPLLQIVAPQAAILPVAMPAHADGQRLGDLVGAVVRELGREVWVVASSDLTHYGPRYGLAPAGVGAPALAWMEQNDHRLLSRIEAMDAAGAQAEALAHRNACGPAAIAAAIATAQALGATRGEVLAYTTSHALTPGARADNIVGYAAVGFCAERS